MKNAHSRVAEMIFFFSFISMNKNKRRERVEMERQQKWSENKYKELKAL